MNSQILCIPGMFVEYSDGKAAIHRYGRVMIASGDRVHVQLFFASAHTVLGRHGAINELYSSPNCKDIPKGILIRNVTVQGPFDEDTDSEFYYRFKYNSPDGSFETVHVDYSLLSQERDECVNCTSRLTTHRGPLFLFSKAQLLRGLSYVHISEGGLANKIQVGGFLVTKEDVAVYPWRHRHSSKVVARPKPDDKLYPEAFRVPKARYGNPPKIVFKTVCRVTSVSYSHEALVKNTFKQVVDPRDVLIQVKIFVRPTDIGFMQIDPYEIVETDQVATLTGRDVERLVEAKFVDDHLKAASWIARGHSLGLARFHFARKFTTATRTVDNIKPNALIHEDNILEDKNQKVIKQEDIFVRITPQPRPVHRLISLDLFSGCGGLSQGLHASGLTESRWAVECDPKAAEAFRLNFPKATVYEEDVEEWYRNLQERTDDWKGPRPGKVDLVCGGPPCQGYSMMNRYLDSLNSCIKYILFENVANFVSFDHGMVLQKILASLLAHEYQVRFAVLRASAHGIPQKRRRTFIWAARMDEQLPKFPLEEYFEVTPIQTLKLGTLEVSHHKQGPVLYSSQGVFEAISDLEQVACGQSYGPPLSVLQHELRNGVRTVSRHQELLPMTDTYKIRAQHIGQGGDWRDLPNKEICRPDGTFLVVKLDYQGSGRRKTMCPCQRGANGKCPPKPKKTDPQPLIPRTIAHTANTNGNWSGAVGRLAWNELFSTIITQPNPLKATGRLLHPSIDRFVTVREISRAQTFQDSFQFHADHKAAITQIGNAVPPLLAAAIGRAVLPTVRPKNPINLPKHW